MTKNSIDDLRIEIEPHFDRDAAVEAIKHVMALHELEVLNRFEAEDLVKDALNQTCFAFARYGTKRKKFELDLDVSIGRDKITIGGMTFMRSNVKEGEEE